MDICNSVTDFGTTKRIVLIIDLNAPSPRKHLLAAISKLLSFPPFSYPSSPTLFAYKFFFSSLSPFRSSSKLSAPSHSLSFDFPSLPPQIPGSPPLCSSTPQATNIATCLRQIMCDYSWDPPEIPDSAPVSSNLVLLFSSIPKSIDAMSTFLNAELQKQSSPDIASSFFSLFQSARNAYASRDIHFSWIDTSEDEAADFDFIEVENIFRVMGWGYCNLTTLANESARIPFGLFYPNIGISPKLPTIGKSIASAKITLTAEEDGQKHYCNVELFQIRQSSTKVRVKTDRIAEIRLNTIEIWQKLVESGYTISDQFLLKEPSCDGTGDSEHSHSSFIASAWQLLLVFLYKKGLVATVSLEDEKGKTFTGVMKPFTLTSAVISAIDEKKFKLQGIYASENFHVYLEDIYSKCRLLRDEKIEFLSRWIKQLGKECEDIAAEVCREDATIEDRLLSFDHKAETKTANDFNEGEDDEKRPWDRIFSSISTYVNRIWAPKVVDLPPSDSLISKKRERTNGRALQVTKRVRFKSLD